jgi:hypothetical protein
MQCACAILSSAACNVLQSFFTLTHKQHDFRKKSLITQCVHRDSLQLLSEIFFILTRTKRDVIEYVCWSTCKIPVIFVRFKRILNFLERCSKNPQISNSTTIRPVQPSCSVRTDRRTDVTKLIVAFRNFAKASKIRVYFPRLKANCYITNSLLLFFLTLQLSTPVLVVTAFSLHLPRRANTAWEPSEENIWYFSLPRPY